jgi:CRAL/TRIO domain
LAKKITPEFFDLSLTKFETMMKLFDAGYCCPLSERDSEGRKIVMFITRNWDTDTFTTGDAIRLLIYVLSVLLEEEETQISGISCVFDHKNLSLSHLFSPLDISKLMHFAKNGSRARLKDNFVINLPIFAAFMVELFTKTLNEKLSKRVFVLKSDDCLKKHIDPSILPKEYGGSKTQAEMMQDFFSFRKTETRTSFGIFELQN